MRIIYFDENKKQVELFLDVKTKKETANLLGIDIASRSKATYYNSGTGGLTFFLAFILVICLFNQIWGLFFGIIFFVFVFSLIIEGHQRRKIEAYNNSEC